MPSDSYSHYERIHFSFSVWLSLFLTLFLFHAMIIILFPIEKYMCCIYMLYVMHWATTTALIKFKLFFFHYGHNETGLLKKAKEKKPKLKISHTNISHSVHHWMNIVYMKLWMITDQLSVVTQISYMKVIVYENMLSLVRLKYEIFTIANVRTANSVNEKKKIIKRNHLCMLYVGVLNKYQDYLWLCDWMTDSNWFD